ncbi:MAG: helix-turn-helix domain-containing protein [Planctomycetaceae bacterium]|jgi:excisionase family DNA binding protein|nr:helix-turn-helix domain-containing protein [Planctomycetaceae bacterium]
MITIPASQPSRICIPAKPVPSKKERKTEPERIGYSIKETTESLGISRETVDSLIREGKIRAIKIGKRVIVSVQSLRDFVDGKKEPCDSERS